MNLLTKLSLDYGGELKPILLPSNLIEGKGITNPSLIQVGNKTYMSLRQVDYTIYHSEGYVPYTTSIGTWFNFNREGPGPLWSRNYLCELDLNDLSIQNYEMIDEGDLFESPKSVWAGLEDARLMNWDGELYVAGCKRDYQEDAQGRIEISKLNEHKVTKKLLASATDENSYCEKNWMPIEGMPWHFIKWTNPTELVKVNPETGKTTLIKSIKQNIKSLTDLRGGSSLIKYKDYYVCVTHEALYTTNSVGQQSHSYYHRFILWDKDFNIVKYSDAFKFLGFPIEFTCGLMFDGDRFIVPFGIYDSSSFLLTLTTDLFDYMVGLRENIPNNKSTYNIDNPISKVVNNPRDPDAVLELANLYHDNGYLSSSVPLFLKASMEYHLNGDLNSAYSTYSMIPEIVAFFPRNTMIRQVLFSNLINFNIKRPEGYLGFARYYLDIDQPYQALLMCKLGINSDYYLHDTDPTLIKLTKDHRKDLIELKTILESKLFKQN